MFGTPFCADDFPTLCTHMLLSFLVEEEMEEKRECRPLPHRALAEPKIGTPNTWGFFLWES